MASERPTLTETRPDPRALPQPLPPTPEARSQPSGHSEGEGPRTIGRYTVLRRLGSGGMGVVYAAFDEALGRRVAVKLLHEHLASGPRGAARALREAQALARLSHPNVVAIHEVGSSALGVHIAMEYVTGVDLRVWLAERERSIAEVLDVFVQAGHGLAAAHAAGLVHRDFKPDNVIVGADGRVRVADFGLAQALLEEERTPGELPTDEAQTTRFAGTPAYMAPEQHLGKVDARADIYSFCVALHEGLYGARPDPTHAAEASGRIPAWLRAVVLRGLEPEPARRWPTMSALLAALASDPQARRRRAIGLAGLSLAVAAVAVVSVLGVLAWRNDVARRTAEAQADQQLAALRALSRARDPSVESAFERFVRAAEHQGTPALTWAWLDRGEAARAHADSGAALDAFASAYTSAATPALAEAALVAIADTFAASGAWDALGAMVRGAGPEAPTGLARHRFAAALLHRDLDGALASAGDPATATLARAVQSLRGATPLGRDIEQWHVADIDDDAIPEVLLLPITGREYEVRARDLTPRATIHLPEGTAPMVGEPLAAAHSDGEVRVYDLRRPDAPPWRAPAATGIYTGRRVDLDRDGRQELYAGMMAMDRGFFVAPELAVGATFSVAHRSTHGSLSDVEALLPADLDGDGRQELIAAVGAWIAYDLRVFRPGPPGQPLELVARRPFGVTSALATYRGPDGRPRLAAVKDDRYPNERAFPEFPFTGPPAGLYVFEFDGAALLPRGHVSAPPRVGDEAWSFGRTPLVADLDGDGLDDLVVPASVAVGEQRHAFALVHRQRPDGGFEVAALRGVYPLALVETDGDSTPELLVRTADDTSPGWVLGVTGAPSGPATLWPPEPPPLEPPPRTLGPTPAMLWQRAHLLARIGLPGAAARAFTEVAALVDDDDGALRDRAAELFAAAGDHAAASALLRELARDPARRPAALVRAALADLQRLELDAAGEALDELAGLDTAPEIAARLAELRANLSPLLALRQRHTFERPLDPAWTVDVPLVAARDPVGAVLRVAGQIGRGPVLRAPLEWDGGPLLLTVELDVEHVDVAGNVRIELRPHGGQTLAGVTIAGYGGGWTVEHSIECLGRADRQRGEPLDVRVAPADQRRRLRVDLWVRSEPPGVTCLLAEGGRLRRADITRSEPLPAGVLELVIGGPIDPRLGRSHARVAVRSLELRGARLARTAPETPLERARRLVTDDDPGAAIEQLAGLGVADTSEALLTAVAYDDLGDHAALVEVLRSVHAADDPGEHLMTLTRLRGDSFRRALRAATGPDYNVRLVDAWGLDFFDAGVGGPDIVRVVRDSTRDLERAPLDAPRRRSAAQVLHVARGQLRLRLGDPAGARADFEAVLSLSTGPDPFSRRSVSVATQGLIALDAVRDPAGARARAERFIAESSWPEALRDILMHDPAIVEALEPAMSR